MSKPSLTERWEYGRTFVGKDTKVRVILDYQDPDAYMDGYLLELTDEGEVHMRLENLSEGEIYNGWPFLELQVLEVTIEESPLP